MIVADLLTMGKKVNNYIVDATDNAAGNLKWTSTTVQEYTVPAGKRWYLLGGQVYRSASATLLVVIKDAADKVIHILQSASAATGYIAYPSANPIAAGQTFAGTLIVLDAGEYVEITAGAAQGAGATASCVVIEVTL